MQLALPKLRTPAALKAFNKELAAADYDLDRWRRRYVLSHGPRALLPQAPWRKILRSCAQCFLLCPYH